MENESRQPLHLTDVEMDLILDLLEQEEKQLLSEIDHTSTGSYRAKLRQRFDLVKSLLERLGCKTA